MADVKAYRWEDIPAREMRPGITQRAFRSDQAIVTYNYLSHDMKPGPHSHPFDQVMIFLNGPVTVHIDEQVVICEPGSILRIPPNAMHWIEPPSPDLSPIINIDVFAPARKDYLPLVEYQTDKFSR